MTREEAIYTLRCHKSTVCIGCMHPQEVGWCENHCRIQEAFDMAIKALKALSDDNIQKIQDLEQAQLEKAYELGKAEAQKWISCSEELPGKGEEVLVTNNWHEVRMAYLTDRTRGKVLCWIVDHNSYHPVERNEILAWMPLPTPFIEPTPQQEGEEDD